MSRFLITTALEQTWRDTEPVLFLGDWCLLFSRRKRWSVMNVEVVPYHWDDDNKFSADYRLLLEFYERLLVVVSKQLNQVHDVDHRLRYWRILIGPWLAYSIQILFDRWSCIQQALSQYQISETIKLDGNRDSLVPNDMADFLQMFSGDEWNHQLCALILEQFTDVPCIETPSERPAARTEAGGIGLRQRLVASYNRMASPFVSDDDAFLASTYLSFLDEMKLHRRLGQVPRLWTRVRPVRVSVDWQQRTWTLNAHARTDFERCALSLLPRLIPTIYLEGYEQSP